MNKLLSHITIVELASVLAGPLAGSFFAELGAKVIKIENKNQGGDVTRQWKLPSESSDEISAYYASANTYKKTVFLDLKDIDDYHELLGYIKKADIVISNYQQKTAKKLKVDYQTISEINPYVIFAQLDAYTHDDARPGYDMVMQAETGWISMTGTKKGELVKMPVALIDVLAAHQMKEAILIALLKRANECVGQLIYISLYKSAISALANQASNYLMAGHIPGPMGTTHPNIAPYGDLYVTKDNEQIMLAIGSDLQFKKLGETLNLNDEFSVTFKYNVDRVKNRKSLNEYLQEIIEKLTSDEINDKLTAANIPFCKVLTVNEVFDSLLAQEMIIEEESNKNKLLKVSNIAFDIKTFDVDC